MNKRFSITPLKIASFIIVMFLALLSGATALAHCSDAIWCSSDQWGNTQIGPFTLYNNIWGATSGQSIWAHSASNWGVTANFPETGGVKTYPNLSLDMNGTTLNTLGSCSSSFNVSLPSSGSWAATYDLWVPSEIMIWMSKNGAVSPIAAAWNPDGTPVPTATNINVGGHTWNVYRGGSNVVSFVRQTNTNSGTVNILALLNWTRDQGWISGTSNLGSFQFGFEITSAPGGLNFTTNSYSMSCGGRGGGGGPTLTPTRTGTRTNTPVGPTRTPTRTATRTNTPGGPTPTRTATQGGGSANCSVNYTKPDDWGAGFNASVTMRNNGASAINGWTLAWTFSGNQQIVNMWNGAPTQTGQSVTVRNMSYNNIINPNGGTVNFGFGANYSGTNAIPSSFTLNGTACNTY